MKDLYLKINNHVLRLKELPEEAAQAISSGSQGSEVFFEVKPEAWASAADMLPDGMKAMYVSQSVTPIPVRADIALGGEVLYSREADGVIKNYRNFYVISGSEKVFVGDQFTNFQGHHVPTGSALPTGTIYTTPHPRLPR